MCRIDIFGKDSLDTYKLYGERMKNWMLYMPIVVFFLRSIPEGILLAFAHYVLVNEKIPIKKLLLSGTILGISSYLIRLLPIHYGVHTIIFLMIYIFIMISVNGIYVLKAIPASIISVFLIFMCDWITVLIYVHVLHIDYETLFSQVSLIEALYSIPALLLATTIVMLGYFYMRQHRNARNA